MPNTCGMPVVLVILPAALSAEFGGIFQDQNKKQEFLDYIKIGTEF